MILWFRNSGRAQLGGSSPPCMLPGAYSLGCICWWFDWILSYVGTGFAELIPLSSDLGFSALPAACVGPRILVAGKCFWEAPWNLLEKSLPLPGVHRSQAANMYLCSQGHMPITDPTFLIPFLSNEILPIAMNIHTFLMSSVCIKNSEKVG